MLTDVSDPRPPLVELFRVPEPISKGLLVLVSILDPYLFRKKKFFFSFDPVGMKWSVATTPVAATSAMLLIAKRGRSFGKVQVLKRHRKSLYGQGQGDRVGDSPSSGPSRSCDGHDVGCCRGPRSAT